MMLAQRGRLEDVDRLTAFGYIFDLKIDGIRCVAEVEDGEVRLSSRQGVSLTRQFPEVTEALVAVYPTGKWIFDGEIAVDDTRGLPSWPRTHKRAAQQSNLGRWRVELPAIFYVFDILEGDGRDVHLWTFESRRRYLVSEATGWDSAHLRPVLHSSDGAALWEVVCEHRLEGMVAKRSAGMYRDGRSRDWLKIKRTSTVSCLVGGMDAGEGSRASTFGALHLYLLDAEGDLVPVGKVGSGFSNQELREVSARMHQPPLIVEVEHLDVSPDGQLRQPVFSRVRDDLTALDCSMEQLDYGSRH